MKVASFCHKGQSLTFSVTPSYNVPINNLCCLLCPDSWYTMSGSAKTEGFIDITQHDNGVNYFLSYLMQVKSAMHKYGMYCETILLRHSLGRNFVCSVCFLCITQL